MGWGGYQALCRQKPRRDEAQRRLARLSAFFVCLRRQVGDHALKSIRVSGANPRLLCVGDTEGTVTLLQVTKSLSELVHGEKPNMGFMFEREALQEKNLLLRERDLKKEKAKEVRPQM